MRADFQWAAISGLEATLAYSDVAAPGRRRVRSAAGMNDKIGARRQIILIGMTRFSAVSRIGRSKEYGLNKSEIMLASSPSMVIV